MDHEDSQPPKPGRILAGLDRILDAALRRGRAEMDPSELEEEPYTRLIGDLATDIAIRRPKAPHPTEETTFCQCHIGLHVRGDETIEEYALRVGRDVIAQLHAVSAGGMRSAAKGIWFDEVQTLNATLPVTLPNGQVVERRTIDNPDGPTLFFGYGPETPLEIPPHPHASA
jgi:hypothetical protein